MILLGEEWVKQRGIALWTSPGPIALRPEQW